MLSTKNYRCQHYIKYILIPSIPLFIISVLSFYNPNLWISTSIDHFYIELFGAILSSILAFYYISNGIVLKNKFTLFIGIGFLVNSLIDVLHVIVSLTHVYNLLFLKFFIPQTWFSGRFFLASMLLISIIKFPYLSKSEDVIQQEISKSHIDYNNIQKNNSIENKRYKNNFDNSSYSILLSVLIIFSLFLSLGSLFVIFPFSVIDDFPIHRTYELVPLVLYFITVFYFYKNKIYQERNVMYTSLILFIIVNIFGQIIMSFSATSHDTAHNVAHILKIAGYFIGIIGLSLSNLTYNIQLRKSSEIINQQYKQLQDSEKVKEEFINIAAHELRNPIQPIMGLSTIMLRDTQNKQNKEFLESILNNSKRLNTLAESLIDVARIHNNTLKINKRIVNFNILVSQIIKEYSPEITLQEKTINQKFKSVKKDILIEADPERLKQVISNLLANALNFTNPGDSILVTVEREKGKEKDVTNKNDTEYVILSVIDTGEGISPEIIDKLFCKFTTRNSVKGSGLGLYICKKIIEAHDGRIWAENHVNKKGANFKFMLPIKNM
ncbi:MAG: ATP-binding protein [Nitrososphaeraceae archaeon]